MRIVCFDLPPIFLSETEAASSWQWRDLRNVESLEKTEKIYKLLVKKKMLKMHKYVLNIDPSIFQSNWIFLHVQVKVGFSKNVASNINQ